MKKEIWAYLQKRPNAEVLCLALVALAGFSVLFFKPYRIHDWVLRNEVVLFWAEIGLLVLIIAILLQHISEQHLLVEQLRRKEGDETSQSQMYNFYDERGELKLSVKPEYLFYLEAADNYVQIHYLNQGKMQMLMIRNSLKNIEWRFRNTTLIRCHRSYLINLSKVQVVKRVEGDVYLDFNDSQINPIPVSKAYADQVMMYFAN